MLEQYMNPYGYGRAYGEADGGRGQDKGLCMLYIIRIIDIFQRFYM